MKKTILSVISLIGVLSILGIAALDTDEEDKKAELGVRIADINEHQAKLHDFAGENGAIIASVARGSAAFKAGLLRGDVIIRIDSETVNKAEDVVRIIETHKPGDVINVVVSRKAAEQTLAVTLEEQRSIVVKRPRIVINKHGDGKYKTFDHFADHPEKMKWKILHNNHYYLGINYQKLNPDLGAYFGKPDGVGILISEVVEESPAAKAGLKAGDVILAINGKEVTDITSLHDALEVEEKSEEKSEDDMLAIKILRNRKEETVNVKAELNKHIGLRKLGKHLILNDGAVAILEDNLEDVEIIIPEIEMDFELPELDFFEDFEREGNHFYMFKEGEEGDEEVYIMAPDVEFKMKDGKVFFDGKEFESYKEFEKFLDSEEFKESHKDKLKKIFPRHNKMKHNEAA